MIRIAICDDEKEIVKQLKKYIGLIVKEEKIIVQLETYLDIEGIKYDLSEKREFDVIFMDIQFGDSDGIELAEFVKSLSSYTAIVFMTGYHERVFDVFRAHPCGFIRKPIDYENVKREFLNAITECSKIEYFEYVANRVLYKLPLKDIVYFRSEGRKVIIKTISEEKEFYGKLDEVEEKVKAISEDFVRIAQSYFMNTDFSLSIKYDVITMKYGDVQEDYKIAQDYRKYIKGRYMTTLDED